MKVISLILRGFPLAGRTLYDPKHNKFVHAKAMFLRGAECGGFCNFYSDAHTTIDRQMLSYSYLSDCILVDSIDKFPFAELDNVISAWRVKWGVEQ